MTKPVGHLCLILMFQVVFLLMFTPSSITPRFSSREWREAAVMEVDLSHGDGAWSLSLSSRKLHVTHRDRQEYPRGVFFYPHPYPVIPSKPYYPLIRVTVGI